MTLDLIEQIESPSPLPNGKDEMNFAEFPIALLSDRVPKGQKSIEFVDQIYDVRRKKIITRRRIIEGSDKYGLPTATDDAVILALIQLTKLKSDFKRPEVEFSRLELIKLLGWTNEGKNYDRIKLSLLRIANVTYNYDNAWWDGRQKTWTTKAFHIIETVEINDSRGSSGQKGLFPSRLVWNEVVFASFQAGFLRNIDFQLCMRLMHPIALRMYRFLGKRFYLEPDLTFELKEFAYQHLCLGRNYEGGSQIARKLQPAIDELESVGFLEPLSEAERFQKKGRDWSIRLIQKTNDSALPPTPAEQAAAESAASPLVTELTARGVTATTAAELVNSKPAELIERQIEYFDWLARKKPDKIGEPGAYLFSAIKTDYAAPKGFVSAAEQRRREGDQSAKDRQASEDRRLRHEEETRQQARREDADTYIKQLTPTKRIALERAALAAASPEARQNYNTPAMAKFRHTLMTGMLREYVVALRDQESVPASTSLEIT
jgi:Replication initiator protein A